MTGFLALMGSGELSDSTAETHRYLFNCLSGPVRPVFVDTPAGFELNVDQIGDKAIAYFRRNFGLDLEIVRYRSVDDDAAAVAAAVAAISRANYIFAGPGSPTYAVRTWRDSIVLQTILTRWQEGAVLVMSSAAAITVGAYALPVYEIYKVGEALHWSEGLDVLGQIGINAAVVPHWNNNSGDQHDTRYCFMGASRFTQLEQMLPSETTVIGIDEYTGLRLDPVSRIAEVFGVGQVSLHQGNQQARYNKGQVIEFGGAFQSEAGEIPIEAFPADTAVEGNDDIERARRAVQDAIQSGDIRGALHALITLTLIAGAGLEQGIYNRSEMAVQALQAYLPLVETIRDTSETDHLVDLILTVRAELREAKQFAAADRLRDQLLGLGYEIKDQAGGSTWSRSR